MCKYTNWKDKLTKLDGHTITYDAIGNPLSDGTWAYVWQAERQLRSMSKVEGGDTITMEFTYNHAGLRTKKVKKVNGTVTETTEYILNGKNVVELMWCRLMADARCATVRDYDPHAEKNWDILKQVKLTPTPHFLGTIT